MAITFRGVTATPADNAALSDATGNITLDKDTGVLASAKAGDLILVPLVQRDGNPTLANGTSGGQIWNSGAMYSPGSSSSGQLFWCRFNGIWTADPIFTTNVAGTTAISAIPIVFAPSHPLNDWAVDVSQGTGNATPTTPFDVTVTGQTAIASSTVTLAFWFNTNATATTWALQTAGWANPNSESQWRNTQGTDLSISAAYKINTAAGATGNVTNRQLTGTGVTTYWVVTTFKEITVPPRRTLLGVG